MNISLVSDVNQNPCLIIDDYRCWQTFTILIDVTDCNSVVNGFDFSGMWQLIMSYECIDSSNTACSTFTDRLLEIQDTQSVALDSFNIHFIESCDSTVYSIEFNGELAFYNDVNFTTLRSSTQFSYPSSKPNFIQISINKIGTDGEYKIFRMKTLSLYFCVTNDTSLELENGCLSKNSNNRTITGLTVFNIIDDREFDYEIYNNDTSDNIGQFSFEFPGNNSSGGSVFTDGGQFLIHAIVELLIQETVTTTAANSNSRRILSIKQAATDTTTIDYSLLRPVIASGTISRESNTNTNDNGNENYINTIHIVAVFSMNGLIVIIG